MLLLQSDGEPRALLHPETAVGRTRIIVRLQTRTRRKDRTGNFGGFVYVLDGFLQRDFLLWVFTVLFDFLEYGGN